MADSLATSIDVDSLLIATDSLAMLDSIPTDTVEKKIKIVKEYFVKVRAIIKYGDGTFEDKIREYPIASVKEREDKLASQAHEERYQLAINIKKGDPIYLYLTPDKTVSSIEIGDQLYLMRGH